MPADEFIPAVQSFVKATLANTFIMVVVWGSWIVYNIKKEREHRKELKDIKQKLNVLIRRRLR